MSLGKAKTRIKAGVTQLQSLQGLKRVLVHFGMGMAVGAIVDLIIEYLLLHFVYPAVGGEAKMRVTGFSIYPNMVDAEGNPYMHYNDILLIIVTVVMLASKKFWFVIGFFAGWYSSGYTNLYDALGLPRPAG